MTEDVEDWNLYTTLGLIVAEATRVELALSDLIGTLLWSSPGAQNVGRGERLTALVGLIRRITEGSDDPWKADIDALCKDCERLGRERDSVAHSEWLWVEDEPLTPHATRRTRSSFQGREWSHEELTRLHLDLANLAWDVHSLRVDLLTVLTNADFAMMGQRVGDVRSPGGFKVTKRTWGNPT